MTAPPPTEADTPDAAVSSVRPGFILAVILGVVAVVLGASLVGQRVFHATDLLERHAPWAFSEPASTVSNPLVSDTVDGAGPESILWSRRLRSGDLAPQWNGFLMGGRPFSAVPTVSMYSPFNAPHTVLPTWYAFGLRKALELAAAIGFTFLFLRRIGLSRQAGLIGGFVFAFSGFQVVWNNWPQARIGALIPGLFWAVEVIVQSPRARSMLPLAGISAVMWLEGFPAVTVWGLAFAGAYGIVRAARRDAGPALRRQAGVGLAGVVLGVGLSAFQLLPFMSMLDDVDLEARAGHPGGTLARRTLATLAVPDAFGNPVDNTYYGPAEYLIYGPVNYVENQAFLGIAALGLAGVAAAYGRRVLDRRRLAFMWAAVAFCGAAIYFHGPLLKTIESIPLLGSSHIGRLRSVMLFVLAVVVAVGAEALVRREPERSKRLWASGAAYAAIAIVVGTGLYQAARMASEAGRVDVWRSEVVVGAIVAMVVLVLIVAAHTRFSARVMWVIPLVIAFEAARFAGAWWPQIPVEMFYPQSPTERYLAGVVGGERIAVTGQTLLPNVPSINGLRSVTAHSFSYLEWRDMLLAIDPGTFRLSATYPTLSHEAAIVGSPLLDRMSARYLVTNPWEPIFGDRSELAEATSEVTLAGGDFIDLEVPEGVRAVVVGLPAGHHPGDTATGVVIQLTGPAGETVSGTYMIPVPIAGRSIEIGIPFVTWQPVAARLIHRGGSELTVSLVDDSPVLGLVHDTDDGLRLVYAADTVIYERLGALPRIRWASRAIVLEDGPERVAALAFGVGDDTVVLSEGVPFGGGEAEVRVVLDDGGDRLVVKVTSTGPGYLVVGDSLQTWWTFSVNGDPVEPLAGDHFGVAFPLEAGSYVLEGVVAPPGLKVGLVASGASLLVLVGVVAFPAWKRRSHSGNHDAE